MYGFGYLHDSNTTYYVFDFSGKVILYDENWSYLTYYNFTGIFNMIAINNSLYLTAYGYIMKTDKYLNVILQTPCSGNNVGIYYDWPNNCIYVVNYDQNIIYIFDLNLILIDSIPVSGYSMPWSVQMFNNELYVGTSTDILVIANKTIIRTFNGCNGVSTWVTSIYFDQNGYMANCCVGSSAVYLYSPNGTYLGKSIATALPFFVTFDTKGRFIVASQAAIRIFN